MISGRLHQPPNRVKAGEGASASGAAASAALVGTDPILAHKGSGQPQPDADFAIGADERTFGGNAPDNIFGGQRSPGWRISGHGVKAVPGSPNPSKTP